MKGIERLLELQELDLSIDRLTTRRSELESGEDVRTARERLEEADGRLGDLRLELDALDREQRRMETEDDMFTRKADAEEKRLYDGSVANPKELEALQHEIASLKQRRGRLEDDLLETMVRREELEERVRQAETEVEELRTRLTEVSGSAATELEDIGRSLGERSAERAAIASEIDPELLELYEDLRRQKKGVGAAALIDGVCQGCHQKLSALELDKLKHAPDPKRCEYCRRILVPT